MVLKKRGSRSPLPSNDMYLERPLTRLLLALEVLVTIDALDMILSCIEYFPAA